LAGNTPCSVASILLVLPGPRYFFLRWTGVGLSGNGIPFTTAPHRFPDFYGFFVHQLTGRKKWVPNFVDNLFLFLLVPTHFLRSGFGTHTFSKAEPSVVSYRLPVPPSFPVFFLLSLAFLLVFFLWRSGGVVNMQKNLHVDPHCFLQGCCPGLWALPTFPQSRESWEGPTVVHGGFGPLGPSVAVFPPKLTLDRSTITPCLLLRAPPLTPVKLTNIFFFRIQKQLGTTGGPQRRRYDRTYPDLWFFPR